jgi:pimeloyl-ACP methyl ester carboxylesterase
MDVLTFHPEGPRYEAPLVCLPGLWSSAGTWTRMASFLGHRGWAVTVPDLVAVRGGIEARIEATERHIRTLGEAPVVIAHDAGGLVAVALARRLSIRALVLVAPLAPHSDRTHALLWSWAMVWSMVARRPVPPPTGVVADLLFDDLPAAGRATLQPEDPRMLGWLLRGESLASIAGLRSPEHEEVPVLVVRGRRDAALAADEAAQLAQDVGGCLETMEGGHWLLGGDAWLACAGHVHRWIVRALGARLLGLYDEAMAEREGAEDADR